MRRRPLTVGKRFSVQDLWENNQAVLSLDSLRMFAKTPRRPDLSGGFSSDNESTSMKAVILAGGLGTRISEETQLKPKPMVEIGGRPILWHIMKLYSAHGVNEFVVCCGYRGYVIKEYFAIYFLHMSDVTFDMANNAMQVHERYAEPWKVTLVDTGDATLTGGRLKRVARYIQDEEAFCFTYGDGLADIDIGKELDFHRRHGKWATVTAVQPPGRYGALQMSGERVSGFVEKPPAMAQA